MDTLEDFLEHHGIKGMKWGVRRSQRRLAEASPDHIRAHEARQKVKKSKGTHVLTNQELKALTERMNLEQNFSRLSSSSTNKAKVKNGHDTVKTALSIAKTGAEVHQLVTGPSGKAALSLVKKHVK